MIKKKITILILFGLFLTLSGFSFAEEICPGSDKWPTASGAEELKIHENDFNDAQAMKSVNYLEKDIPKIIKKYEHKNVGVMWGSGFGILLIENF
jgi:hypothetical protein